MQLLHLLGVTATLELTCHCSPWPGQPSLHWQSTCSPPKQTHCLGPSRAPKAAQKAFLKKLGFTLRIHSCERGGGQGRRGDGVIPNLGGLSSRGRAQAPPLRLAAQAVTTEGRGCREKDIGFSQPKSTLKGQNPQTVPKSQGWCWEGTAAWQLQGTDQSCHSQQLQQLEPSHSLQSSLLGEQLMAGLGLGGDMGKQEIC